MGRISSRILPLELPLHRRDGRVVLRRLPLREVVAEVLAHVVLAERIQRLGVRVVAADAQAVGRGLATRLLMRVWCLAVGMCMSVARRVALWMVVPILVATVALAEVTAVEISVIGVLSLSAHGRLGYALIGSLAVSMVVDRATNPPISKGQNLATAEVIGHPHAAVNEVCGGEFVAVVVGRMAVTSMGTPAEDVALRVLTGSIAMVHCAGDANVLLGY